MLGGLVDALRNVHPECVDRPIDALISMSGRALTTYVLQLYENIEYKWKENRLINRLMKKIAAGWRS